MARSHARATQRAFTLIELLVVIAIIAILAAILFPVFAQAKAAAKQASCLSNTKQLITAELIYMGDYDGAIHELYPGGCVNEAGNVAPFTWMGTLQPYTKNKDIYNCPAASNKLTAFDFENRKWVGLGMNSFLGLYFNYYNFQHPEVCDGDATPTSYIARPITESIVQFPAQTVFNADSWNNNEADGTQPRAAYIDPHYGIGRRFGISDRHNKRTNINLLDGHAKSFVTFSLLNQGAISSTADDYMIQTNYNAAHIIWDVDAPNMETNPNLWPTTCCTAP